MEKQVEFRIRLNEVLLLGRLYFKKIAVGSKGGYIFNKL